MTLSALDGAIWVLALLLPLIWLQRALHFEIQAFFLILTRRPAWSTLIFSLLFLPGVALHETSHFLMAKVLGVRTGRVSLTPRALPDGKLQLGYVETAVTDPLRDTLVGAAPLMVGGLVVAYISIVRLGMQSLGGHLLAGDLTGFLSGLGSLTTRPDFWLWFYLVFAVSSTMLPSSSDRRAWLPVLLAVVVLLAVAVLSGAGAWLLAVLAPPFNRAMRALAAVLAISAGVHAVLLPPWFAAHRLAGRLTGLRVE